MKKSLFFIHPRMVTGGAEKALANLLHHIDYDKYEVTLWLPDLEGAMTDQIDKRVHVFAYKNALSGSYGGFLLHLLRNGKLKSSFFSLYNRICSRIYVNRFSDNLYYALKSKLVPLCKEYDLSICFHSALSIESMDIQFRCIHSKKTIAWIHSDITKYFSLKMKSDYLERYAKYDIIVCVSKSLRDAFLSYYPQFEDKTCVIYNLQNINEIKCLSEEYDLERLDCITLTTVGRIHKEKGQSMIPEIARRLLEQGYRFRWYIVGDGPDRLTVEENISKYDVADTVIVTGMKKNPYPYIRNCTLYIQPSHTEGFCLTTFEAMILGKPLVVTDLPVFHELLTRNEAVFCKDSVDDFVDGIACAIKRQQSGDFYIREIGEAYYISELEKLDDLFNLS